MYWFTINALSSLTFAIVVEAHLWPDDSISN